MSARTTPLSRALCRGFIVIMLLAPGYATTLPGAFVEIKTIRHLQPYAYRLELCKSRSQ